MSVSTKGVLLLLIYEIKVNTSFKVSHFITNALSIVCVKSTHI